MSRIVVAAILVYATALPAEDPRSLGRPGEVLSSGADLYIRDDPKDTGVEPNATTDPIYLSPDIWIRQSPDPAWQPYPFDPDAPPWTPTPDAKAEYRDPLLSVPNYVYVRVTNRGTAASDGTERLRVYWASASTGLAWEGQWVDFLSSQCGKQQPFGMEITKPRRNAATVSETERNAYRDAIIAIGTDPALKFDVSYWHKQNEVHTASPMNWHSTPLFLPWHREYLNRYEVLLQRANPKVTLLYWDWTTDPEFSTEGFNFFTTDFMGVSGRGIPGGAMVTAPFFGPGLLSPTITRELELNIFPPVSSDQSLITNDPLFPSFALTIEKSNHDFVHPYLGGPFGTISNPSSAAMDPFFFLLHANVDRIWAQWQRAPAETTRLDPAKVYGNDATNPNLTSSMSPWDGTSSLSIHPWTTNGKQIVSKVANDPSVVTPPIYDTAPLTIPVLQPGEAVVLQIPWYPPNPKDYSCVTEPEHFCLLARIETSDKAPFGMKVPEIASVGFNTVQNNNIAWKNISVVDDFTGAKKTTSVLIRNVFDVPVTTALRFRDAQPETSFFRHSRISVDLTPQLYARWIEGGAIGTGVRPVSRKRRSVRTDAVQPPSTVEILAPDAALQNMRLEPGETFAVDVIFELARDYQPRTGFAAKWDITQTGTPGNREEFVGGQRFEIPLERLVLVKRGALWRYRDDGIDPGPSWMQPGYDDSQWREGPAELGAGDGPLTTTAKQPTIWVRHAFDVGDPSFYRNALLRLKRDDGAILYLNGREIHRTNVPVLRPVTGVQEETFFPIAFDPALLGPGRNVLALEIHQAAGAIDDVTFDLELSANRASTTFAPEVVFLSPTNGTLAQQGDPVTVVVDAFDSDGGTPTVALYADGEFLGNDKTPPYEFAWTATAIGPKRLRAIATDDEGVQSPTAITVTILLNTPPAVRLLSPADGTMLLPGEILTLSAEASDPGGGISRVEYYAKDMRRFNAPVKMLGSSSTAPYRVSILDVPAHAMVWAVAVDDCGERTQSVPVRVMRH